MRQFSTNLIISFLSSQVIFSETLPYYFIIHKVRKTLSVKNAQFINNRIASRKSSQVEIKKNRLQRAAILGMPWLMRHLLDKIPIELYQLEIERIHIQNVLFSKLIVQWQAREIQSTIINERPSCLLVKNRQPMGSTNDRPHWINHTSILE